MNKKILLIIVAAVLLVSVIALTACATTEAKFYEDLLSDANKAQESLQRIINTTSQHSYNADFDVIYTYHDNVSRGTPDKEGWVNNDYTDWYVQIAAVSIIYEKGEGDAFRYYAKVTVYEEMTDGQYDKVKGKRNFTPALSGEYWLSSDLGENKIFYDAEGNKVDSKRDLPNVYVAQYGIDDLFTLWLDMLGRYYSIEDDFNDVTDATYGFKLYTNLCQIGFRYVYDLQGNKVDSWHSDSVSKNYGSDLSYDWGKVSGLDNVRLSVTSSTKHNMSSFELFTERVLAYYQAKNEVDKSLVLKADVWAKTQITVDINSKKVPAIPALPQ